MDFYKTYKLFKQRSSRYPNDQLVSRITIVCRALFETSKCQKRQKSPKALIKVIDRIIKLEIALPWQLKRYGKAMKTAVLADSYTLNRPYEIAHFYKEREDDWSTIYVLSSPTKPGQVKLGATTNILKRIASYKSRYRYPIKLEKSEWVKNPMRLEKIVSDLAAKHRVSRMTHGDSIEWYGMSAAKMWSLVKSSLMKQPENSTSRRSKVGAQSKT